MLTFRIDDVSVNTDSDKLSDITELLRDRHPKCEIIYGVSVAVCNMDYYRGIQKERVFPKIFNAFSDPRKFYRADLVGVPHGLDKVVIASHGLIHVDHRLLTRECQEMSILVSCSVLKSKIFIPPFNKWNKATEEICKEHGIELIKFEDGWKHLAHEKFFPDGNWYFHTHDFTFEEFAKRL